MRDARRARAMAWVARILSWPLAVVHLALVLAWRLIVMVARTLRYGFRRDHGLPEGFKRFLGPAWQGLRYVVFVGDDLARPDGTVRRRGDSPGPWQVARKRTQRSRVAMFAWCLLALYLMAGAAAQVRWIAPGFDVENKDRPNVPPEGLDGEYFFGSDYIGHSVGEMAIRGIAVALWIGVVAAVVSCVIGGILGALAGFFGGWVDDLIVWLYTTLESVPEMLLVLAAAYALKQNPGWREAYDASFLKEGLGLSLGLTTIVLVIGLVSWTGVCRQVRGEFIRQRDLDYVTAARALGVPTRRIVFRHVFPNVFHLVLISFSLLFIGAIKYEVVLTFLGVGVEPGDASWGRMISEAKLELVTEPPRWWQLTAATGMLFGLVLSVNLFVDALRDALDPRTQD